MGRREGGARLRLLETQPRHLAAWLVHDHCGDDAAASVPSALCGGARRERSCGDRAVVGHRLWRDLPCCRLRGADLGPARRHLRTQAHAGARQPRHDDRHIADGHGRQRLATRGAAPFRRPGRRLCIRLDGAGGDTDAERPVRLGARRALVRHHGRQSRRSSDRRGAAAYHRHPGHVSGGRRHDLLRLPGDDLPDQGREVGGPQTGGQGIRRLEIHSRQAAGRRNAGNRVCC